MAVSESVVEHASPPTEGPSYLRPRPDEDAGSVRSATSESRPDAFGKIGSAPIVSATVARSETHRVSTRKLGEIGAASTRRASIATATSTTTRSCDGVLGEKETGTAPNVSAAVVRSATNGSQSDVISEVGAPTSDVGHAKTGLPSDARSVSSRRSHRSRSSTWSTTGGTGADTSVSSRRSSRSRSSTWSPTGGTGADTSVSSRRYSAKHSDNTNAPSAGGCGL